MQGSSRDDIRRLLKKFGIAADEAVVAHLARNPEGAPLRIKLTLKDLTDYGDYSPEIPLHIEIDGQVRRP